MIPFDTWTRHVNPVNVPQADLLEHWSLKSHVAFGQHGLALRDAEASYYQVWDFCRPARVSVFNK
jgi:hypothetical protein